MSGLIERIVTERLARINSVDREVHSLVLVDAEGALATARHLDQLPGPYRLGPLSGTTFVVKDNIDVAGQVTACGSNAHDGRPAVADAPVVARLKAAGAVLLGRANMDELAMGASTGTSAAGPTRNPWDLRRSPGGSSGGCAAAVALGLVDFAVGTDTGGSIREPAAQCGVFGLAPTPGLVPTDGVVPFDPSCDRVGPLAATPGMLGEVLAAMAALATVPPKTCDVVGLRIGLIEEATGSINQPGIRRRLAEAVDSLTAAGATVTSLSVPDAGAALAAYLDLTASTAATLLAPWADSGRLGREATRRLQLGRDLQAPGNPRLERAAAVRTRLSEQISEGLQRFDVLLSSTLPTTAPLFAPAGPPTADVADPMTAPYTDCWTVLANLAGVPAVSIPAGRSSEDAMPVGVMFLAPPGADPALVALAGRLVGDLLPNRPGVASENRALH